MNDVRKVPLGQRVFAHVALVPGNRRTVAQVREPPAKGLRIAGEHDRVGLQAELLVGVRKRLQKPDAEETRPAGHQQPRSPQLLPERTRVDQHVIEVFWQEFVRGHWRIVHIGLGSWALGL